jgi:hypothetical protein
LSQKFDPNLRAAVEDIRAILKKRNIAGHVLLASPTHTEFALLYDTASWSAVSFENSQDNIGIKIKAKKDVPEDQAKLASTMHMLCTFQDMMANGFSALDTVIGMVRKHVTVLHLNRIGTKPDATP